MAIEHSLDIPVLFEVTERNVYKRSNVETIVDENKGITLYRYNEEVIPIKEYIATLMDTDDYDALVLVVDNLITKVDSLEARVLALENA